MPEFVISSGHAKYVQGAIGPKPWGLNEVDEARRVVDQVTKLLKTQNVGVVSFHDDVSKTQDENLDRIVDFHNAQGPHECDVSVHFNAYEETDKAMGTECLYVTQDELAEEMADAIAAAGMFTNRGPKKNTNLYFLNNTAEPAILIEVCFVDSQTDADLYRGNFDAICEAIATTLVGKPPVAVAQFEGPASHFGGPDDMGVDDDEGLAFFDDYEDAPHLFLDEQPPGTTGLARRLDPDEHYVACRWDYDVTPKEMLADKTLRARVTSKKTGKTAMAWPADWGPHVDTGRAADLSPGLMKTLGIETDDEVEVVYPA